MFNRPPEVHKQLVISAPIGRNENGENTRFELWLSSTDASKLKDARVIRMALVRSAQMVGLIDSWIDEDKANDPKPEPQEASDAQVMDAIKFIQDGYSLEETWNGCLFPDDRKSFKSFKDFCQKVNELMAIMERTN